MSGARSWPIAAWAGVVLLMTHRCATSAYAQQAANPASPVVQALRRIVQSGEALGVAQNYGGTIYWHWTEGRASERANLRVNRGVVECGGAHVSPPDDSYTLNGRGSMSMELGLPGGKYVITVACPGRDGEINHASPMSTYKQAGGAVGLDRRTSQPIYPRTLKGSWTGEFGSGTATMRWDLCLNCVPPAPVPPPTSVP